jgi:TctA family transporter
MKNIKKLIPMTAAPRILTSTATVVLMFAMVIATIYTGPMVINPIAADVYTAVLKSFFMGITVFIITKINMQSQFLNKKIPKETNYRLNSLFFAETDYFYDTIF